MVVLVFYHCLTDDHKFSSLNNTHLFAHGAVRLKSCAACLAFSSGSQRAGTKVLAGLNSHAEALPISFSLLEEFSSFWLQD